MAKDKKSQPLTLSDLLQAQKEGQLGMSAGIVKQLSVQNIDAEKVSISNEKGDSSSKIIDELKKLNKSISSILNSNITKMADAIKNNNSLLNALVLNTSKKTTPTLSKNDLSQEDLENQEYRDKSLDLLEKIERNTASSNKTSDNKKGLFSGFGDLLKKIGGTLLGAAAGLLALGAAVWVISKAFDNFSKLSWPELAKGLSVIGALTAAVVLMRKADSIKTLLALSVSLFATYYAFEKFAKLDWESLGKGFAVLGALTAAVAIMGKQKTNLTMLAVAGALLVTTYSFEKFAAIDWEGIGKGVAVLAALTAATFAIGLASPQILLGAAAMAAIAGALWIASEAFETVADSMENFTIGLKDLASIDAAGLFATAGAITALGASMVAFGAGEAARGLGSLIGRLLTIGTDSPIKQLLKLSSAGDGLNKTASGLERIAAAMAGFSKLSSDSMNAINDFPWAKATAFVSAGGSMSTNDTVITSSNQTPQTTLISPGTEVTPSSIITSPKAASVVYDKSSQNAEAAMYPFQTPSTNIINAPTTISKQTQTNVLKVNVRDQDTTLKYYHRARFTF
jgi:hypothetical protein